MKIPAFNRLLCAMLALSLFSFHGLRGQEAPPPPASAAPGVEAPPAPAAANAPEAEKSELRRLDVPPVAPDEPKQNPTAEANQEPQKDEQAVAPAEPSAAPTPPASEKHRRTRHRDTHDGNGNARVSVWDNAVLEEGESADGVVSVVGSSTAHGHVNDAVVSILGSSTTSGEVNGSVVSILGSSRVTGGSVGDTVVAILGSAFINAPVRGEVVAVLGNVQLGPNAVVDGDINCVGGTVTRDPNSIVKGQVNHVAVGHFSDFEGLHAWITQCLMYARPLAFGPNLMWAWWLAIGFLLFYLVLAALFSRSVENCVSTFEQKPGASVLTAALVFIVAPFATILLAFTIIGAPALVLFLLIAGVFGKVVMIAWLGRRITKLFSGGGVVHPALCVLIGGVIVLGLYTIPVVGFITAKFISWVGLGVVVYTVFVGFKRSRAARAVPPPPPTSPSPASAGVAATSGLESESAGFTGAIPVPPGPEPAFAAAPPVVVSAVTLHRAGFWIRIGASVLDAVVIGVAVGLSPHGFKPNFLLLYAAYCIVLWGLRGTTIGGIVCSLKVVRLDDRPVDWPTALVRGLAGFLSFFAAGIGFIWVAFDDQRQSWHDKIAGTTVVYVPKGVSLV
ncbi:MAG: RDD family protein [Opitutus sp.]